MTPRVPGRFIPALAAATAGFAAPPPADAQAVVFAHDFEGALPPSIGAGVALVTAEQGYAGLGHAGNRFAGSFLRSPTGNVISLSLTNLPPHSSLSVLFLLAAIDSLDGTGSFPEGDFLRITLDGATIFRESFANALPSQVQSYIPPPAVQLARRVDLGFSGPGSYYTDSAYDLSLDPVLQQIAHSATTATITFQIEGPGIQPLDDESWAMDNLRIAVGCAPPVILAQPRSPIVCPGAPAEFSVEAAGTGLTYRWQRELGAAGSNTWGDLVDGTIPGSAAVAAGAGTPTLSVTGIDPANPGWFCCVVTSSCGGIATSPCTVTVRPGGYANCDGSTAPPVLNVADFTCFLQKFAAADPYANCDGSTTAPALNVADFTCFLQRFAAGCP